jgi:hypothetical protein
MSFHPLMFSSCGAMPECATTAASASVRAELGVALEVETEEARALEGAEERGEAGVCELGEVR